MTVIRLFVNGGAGDYHTGLARLESIYSKYPDAKLHLYGICFKPSYNIIKWMLSQYLNCFESIDLRYDDIGVLAQPFDKSKFSKSDLILDDWRDVDGKHFEITYPFRTRSRAMGYLSMNKNDKVLGIHMMTSHGDKDFVHVGGLNVKRYWSKKKWEEFLIGAKERGYRHVLAFGAKNENYGFDLEKWGITSLLGEDLDKVVSFIQLCDYFVGTNSWCFQVAGYSGIPTSVLYFTNSQWIPYHISDKMKNINIITDRSANPQLIFDHMDKTGKALACQNTVTR